MEIFNYVYGTDIKAGFYTPEEYREKQKQNNLNENSHVPGAYMQGKTAFCNLDRLDKCDNFYVVAVPFHEGIHYHQHNKSFSELIMNRVFANNVWIASLYEDEKQSKEDINYKDLYTMSPQEVHAYRMQFYLEEQLTEKIGIEKTQNALPKKELKLAQKIWEKARTMGKISEYRQNNSPYFSKKSNPRA